MRTYVATTGVLFALVTLSHIWRMVEEGRELATSPGYLAITTLTAALAAWAWYQLRHSRRS